MYANKLISKLFHLNRNDYNKAEKEIEKILLTVYNKGKQDGKKELKQLIKIKINSL